MHLTLESIWYLNKIWEIEAMSEIFGIPPDEIARYLTESESKDKKHILAVFDFYKNLVLEKQALILTRRLENWLETKPLSGEHLAQNNIILGIDILKYLVTLWPEVKSTMKLCEKHFWMKSGKVPECFKAAIENLSNNHIQLADALLHITESEI